MRLNREYDLNLPGCCIARDFKLENAIGGDFGLNR